MKFKPDSSDSEYKTIEEFIERTMRSFSLWAPQDCVLVIKHHPMDRAYTNYDSLITKLSRELNISDRCFYIHDQHLPTLLQSARGVVLINSTVGMSALHHACPLKVMGRAIYDMEGLTFQGSLDEFWNESATFRPNMKLYENYRKTLIEQTQINGNFYRKLSGLSSATGLHWPDAN